MAYTKEERRVYARAYYIRNKEIMNANSKRWWDRSKESMNDKRRAYDTKYAKDNPAKFSAKSAKRRALKLDQTPDMNPAELAEIEAMYMYNQIMPGIWHVDHIDPLAKGGLHHPANLQILSEYDNCSKGAN
jgi:hypothetical protein